jgi:hypothetical protein
MDKLQYLTSNHIEFFNYLKDRIPVYHKSNIFFRDVQYGIMGFFKSKKVRITYAQAEDVAGKFLEAMEKTELLRKLDKQSWVLEYPDFSKKAS